MSTTPHDALFRAVFSQAEHARGELRAVVPAVLADTVDWSTLAIRPDSLVDAALNRQYTDLQYSAKLRDGGEVRVCFLFEHQSSLPTEGLMGLRLLSYQVGIWEDLHRDHPNAKKLPMIIPIVMYHGDRPWSEPRPFDALLDIPDSVRPAVEPYLVRFSYVLHDLSKISDDELRAGARRTALSKLASMCFKYARTRADFIKILSGWMGVAREVARAPNGLAALEQVMRYILKVNEHVEQKALEALLESEIGPEAKDIVVTLIEQGRQAGRQEGRQESLQRLQALLLRMLRRRFGDAVDSQVEQRVATASTEQLESWTEGVPSAATISELFAG
jgi:predicted transposase/invertase (TIGR01784 family)